MDRIWIKHSRAWDFIWKRRKRVGSFNLWTSVLIKLSTCAFRISDYDIIGPPEDILLSPQARDFPDKRWRLLFCWKQLQVTLIFDPLRYYSNKVESVHHLTKELFSYLGRRLPGVDDDCILAVEALAVDLGFILPGSKRASKNTIFSGKRIKKPMTLNESNR